MCVASPVKVSESRWTSEPCAFIPYDSPRAGVSASTLAVGAAIDRRPSTAAVLAEALAGAPRTTRQRVRRARAAELMENFIVDKVGEELEWVSNNCWMLSQSEWSGSYIAYNHRLLISHIFLNIL